MKNLESNELIVDFMGIRPVMYSPDSYGWSDQPYYSIHENTPEKVMRGIISYVKYDSDWNWLMEVVEKCLSSPEIGESRDWDHHYASIHDGVWGLSKENTYTAVVEFIKWYNKNK